MDHELPPGDSPIVHAGAVPLAPQFDHRSPIECKEAATGRAWLYHSRPIPYLATFAIVGACGVLSWVSHLLRLTEANIVMIFLAGVALVSACFGHGPAILAAVFGVLAFDFFFVHPTLSFAPGDTQYFITFAVMLGIGLLISELTARLRAQLQNSRRQEHRTSQLYYMTRQLCELAGTEFLIPRVGRQLADIFSAETIIIVRSPDGSLQLRFGNNTDIARHPMTIGAAQWVAANYRMAGLGTDTLPESAALFVPMIGSQRTFGVIGMCPTGAPRLFDLDERRILQTCANLIALSLERDQSLTEAHAAHVETQSERLRNSLLSSVSHDLRTPLAMISVTAANLLEDATPTTWPEKREMLQTIVDEAHRLSRQVVNLLGIARLDSGPLVLDREWHVLEELIGVALNGLRRELQSHMVRVNLDEDFPLLWIAGELMQQVLANLLENAARYTPPGSVIEISAVALRNRVEIAVADNGPGLPSGGESKVFDRFFRGTTKIADGQVGIGLGLSICRGIVHAHGGQIRAANRPSGGAEFAITLHCAQQKFELASQPNHAAMA